MRQDFLVFLFIVAIVLAIPLMRSAFDAWRLEREFGRELDEPFAAEVMYQGHAVADLSDRNCSDMFWCTYKIAARSIDAEKLIADDNLWERCEFYFRDPKTQKLSTMAFAGGGRPFVKEGRILLRGLYFGGSRNREKHSPGSDTPTAAANERV